MGNCWNCFFDQSHCYPRGIEANIEQTAAAEVGFGKFGLAEAVLEVAEAGFGKPGLAEAGFGKSGLVEAEVIVVHELVAQYFLFSVMFSKK